MSEFRLIICFTPNYLLVSEIAARLGPWHAFLRAQPVWAAHHGGNNAYQLDIMSSRAMQTFCLPTLHACHQNTLHVVPPDMCKCVDSSTPPEKV
jgi:hypothetical protein